MLKFTNKRDVDRHVGQMTKNLSETEVNSDEKSFRQSLLLENANLGRLSALKCLIHDFFN